MKEKVLETSNSGEFSKPRRFNTSMKSFLKKSVPMSLVLLITFNSTLGVAIIQYYFYRSQVNALIAYKEKLNEELENTPEKQAQRLEVAVLPEGGVVLPVKWGDVGTKLVSAGVIDQQKFLSLFRGGPLSKANADYTEILTTNYDEAIVLTRENSRFVLNALWALGLAQQSLVLEDMRSEYPQVENLAATGGWNLAQGSAMDHYGKHNLFNLSPEQQVLIKQIASNIYRPCCNNHTAFADCNHGMAMLGLIEMMVAKGYSEDEIYNSALAVNSIWFPDTYLTIAKYMEDERNLEWAAVVAKEVLGAEFSSGSGYRSVLAKVKPVQGSGGGGGCGV